MKKNREHLSFSIITRVLSHIMILFPLTCIVSATAFAAREDTAAISFQTNVPPSETGKPYVVRRGDTLHTIIRDNLGPQTARSQAEIMEEIRRLNPKMANLSMIYPGQSIILPGRAPSPGSQRDAFGGNVVLYTVQRGDSLEKILMRQLNVRPNNMTSALRAVKEINPTITDINRIAVSQIIRLPASKDMVMTADKFEDPRRTQPSPDDDFTQPITVSETLIRNLLLAGQIINAFRGSLIMEGKYSIPIANHSQITIDCASIPMIEFDNGHAVFIALKTRLPEQVRNIIVSDWPTYRFISVNERDTLTSILNKIMNQSGIYRMEKGGQIVVGEKPNIHVTPDWTIHQVDKESGLDVDSFGEHGLIIYRDPGQSLPGYILQKLSDHGLVLTEIASDRGIITGKPADPPPPATLPDISGASRIDMIYNLLQMLGQNATKNVELSLVDRSKGGFHLTMRADILLKRGNRNAVLTFGALPGEFENILKEERYDVISLPESDSKDRMATKVLNYLQIPNSSNFFRLTVNRTDASNSSLISAVFPAVQVMMPNKRPYYLVDFSFDQEFYAYFSNLQEVNIIQY